MVRKRITLAALFALVLAGFLGLFFLWRAPETGAQEERLIIPLGSKGNDSIKKLIENGFVKNGFSIKLALLLQGSPNQIKPGAYRISKSMNVWELAGVLTKDPYMRWVVIQEGLRKEEIAELLARELGWSESEKKEWVDVYTNKSADLKEGVYFPDTYLIPLDETPEKVADRLRIKFEEKFGPYSQEAINQNIRWPTLLKVASLVQREAAGKEDMPLVAGIIWNRLLENMKLDIDATVQYARGDEGEGWWAPISAEDKKIDSPYNTYIYKGLPPTPIANPGIDAIKAALFPEKTDCFYYLHADSKIYCAKTYKEHQENIEKYL